MGVLLTLFFAAFSFLEATLPSISQNQHPWTQKVLLWVFFQVPNFLEYLLEEMLGEYF